MRKQDLWPLGALAFLLATTAAWWTLALWPLPSETPAWLLRTRDVCFNATGTGLPDRSGWILLVGEPLGMLAVLVIGWRAQMADSLRRLVSSLTGRVVAISATGLVTLSLAAAAVRVAAAGVPGPALSAESSAPETYPRLDRNWPAMDGLVDQSGRPFSRGSLGGRRAMVTFAYAHCTTVCPLLVQGALEAREELRGEVDLAVVALTLDPWRDTPARLPDMAARWSLQDGDVVLGGGVEAVEAALSAWGVPRERDERTGEVSHPSLTFLVEGDGTVAYATSGAASQLVALARRLR